MNNNGTLNTTPRDLSLRVREQSAAVRERTRTLREGETKDGSIMSGNAPKEQHSLFQKESGELYLSLDALKHAPQERIMDQPKIN